MSENKPPAYRWIVTLPTGQFSVDAAYPVTDDGHLLLKECNELYPLLGRWNDYLVHICSKKSSRRRIPKPVAREG